MDNNAANTVQLVGLLLFVLLLIGVPITMGIGYSINKDNARKEIVLKSLEKNIVLSPEQVLQLIP